MKVTYEMKIMFEDENILILLTGDRVEFEVRDDKNKPLRPRHVKLVTMIQQIMKDYT